MHIKIFGVGCTKCTELATTVEKLAEKHGIQATVEKVTDVKEMMRYSVFSTPALAIDDVVKCSGRVPETSEILDWLSENTTTTV